MTTRQCNGCTACCEGHLYGEAHGHQFFKGRFCHFMNSTGCSIYENRPLNPCASYRCAWLADTKQVLPEWMKPSDSGVIITERTWGPDNQPFWEIIETNAAIKPSVLIWFMLYQVNNGTAMSIQVEGGWYHFGPNEFVKLKMS